jgi:hypothetical protein
MKSTRTFLLGGLGLALAIGGTIQFLGSHPVQNAAAWANRLRQIDGAKGEWALENHKQTNDIPICLTLPTTSPALRNYSPISPSSTAG